MIILFASLKRAHANPRRIDRLYRSRLSGYRMEPVDIDKCPVVRSNNHSPLRMHLRDTDAHHIDPRHAQNRHPPRRGGVCRRHHGRHHRLSDREEHGIGNEFGKRSHGRDAVYRVSGQHRIDENCGRDAMHCVSTDHNRRPSRDRNKQPFAPTDQKRSNAHWKHAISRRDVARNVSTEPRHLPRNHYHKNPRPPNRCDSGHHHDFGHRFLQL